LPLSQATSALLPPELQASLLTAILMTTIWFLFLRPKDTRGTDGIVYGLPTPPEPTHAALTDASAQVTGAATTEQEEEAAAPGEGGVVAVHQGIEVKYTKLFIGNRWVDSLSGETFDTLNPSTGEVICAVSSANEADVDLAVEAANEVSDPAPQRCPTKDATRLPAC
jgi:hypothetical protein